MSLLFTFVLIASKIGSTLLAETDVIEINSYNEIIDDAIFQVAQVNAFQNCSIIEGFESLKRSNCSLHLSQRRYLCLAVADKVTLTTANGIKTRVSIRIPVVSQLQNDKIEQIWLDKPEFVFLDEKLLHSSDGMFGFWANLWNGIKKAFSSVTTWVTIIVNGIKVLVKAGGKSAQVTY